MNKTHICIEMVDTAAAHSLNTEDLEPVYDDRGLWLFGAYAHMVPIIYCPYCGKRLVMAEGDVVETHAR